MRRAVPLDRHRYLTVAELARELGAHRATVGRAIERARHTANPAPAPVNPGHPQPRYPAGEFLAWWPTRPGARRPRRP